MFSKPSPPEAKMHVLAPAMMPLPRSLAGSRDSRNQNFKRAGIAYEQPDKIQNNLIDDLQASLYALANCECCTKSKYNPRTKRCEGENCLKQAFPTEDGEFDYAEARKCFLHYHEKYANFTQKELRMWAFVQFSNCCHGVDDIGNIIHSFNLNYGSVITQKSVRVCRRVWAYFMGQLSKHRMDILSKAYKNEYTPEGSTLTLRQDYSDSTMHDTDLKEISELFVQAGICIDDIETKRMGMVRRTEMETFLWFRDYFELIGDPQPNLQQVHLDKTEKTEIYEIYVNEIGRENALSFSSWRKFWDNVFPDYVIRQWKSVSGKCEHCAAINAGRRTQGNSAATIAAFRKLHILHKTGHFMPERLSYHQRRKEAAEDDTVFSGIIDIMDNNHCQCPYEANKNHFSGAINQGICGFLRHGHDKGLTIYRTTGLVGKGSNLTIYAISDQLGRYVRKYGRFPRKVYLQIDGGAENANETMIAWMELLVAKHLIAEIYLTRLPVGHTHEDIDAMFGHIWTWFRKESCHTLEEYRLGIEECFKDSQVPLLLLDVYVIPDYVTFLGPHFDNIDRWAKKELTVHQWYISVVEKSIYFPLGVRTLYRDYVNDKVVELKSVEKSKAATRIGQLTGYDPITHYSRWYPDENSIRFRPVAGFFVLKSIPLSHPTTGIVPQNFDQKDIDDLLATKNAIIRSGYFKLNSPKREEWNQWFESTMPSSTDAKEYILSHDYHQPLNEWLSDTVKYEMPSHFLNGCHQQMLINKDFEWPEDLISLATPHVKTEWFKLTIPPRQYKYCSPYLQELTEGFEANSLGYYENVRKLTNAKIIEVLSRRVNEQGKHPTLTGSKEELVGRLFENDYVAYVNLYHPPRDAYAGSLVGRIWENDVPRGTAPPVLIQMQDLVSLKPASVLSTNAFVACISLLNSNEDAISRGFNQIYQHAKNPETRRSCLIAHPSASLHHMTSDKGDLLTMGLQVANLPHRFIIPLRLDNTLLVVNFAEKQFIFYSVKDLPNTALSQKADKYFRRFLAMLTKCQISNTDWSLSINFNIIKTQNNLSSPGDIRILAIIIHAIKELPIMFTDENLNTLRANITLALYYNTSVL